MKVNQIYNELKLDKSMKIVYYLEGDSYSYVQVGKCLDLTFGYEGEYYKENGKWFPVTSHNAEYVYKKNMTAKEIKLLE